MTKEDLIKSINNEFDTLIRVYSASKDFKFVDFAIVRMVLYDAMEIVSRELLKLEEEEK